MSCLFWYLTSYPDARRFGFLRISSQTFWVVIVNYLHHRRNLTMSSKYYLYDQLIKSWTYLHVNIHFATLISYKCQSRCTKCECFWYGAVLYHQVPVCIQNQLDMSFLVTRFLTDTAWSHLVTFLSWYDKESVQRKGYWSKWTCISSFSNDINLRIFLQQIVDWFPAEDCVALVRSCIPSFKITYIPKYNSDFETKAVGQSFPLLTEWRA